MPDPKRSSSERLAILARYAIVVLFGVLVFSGLSGQKESGFPNFLSPAQVHATGGICSAPGFLMLTVHAGQKFFIVDTLAAPKRICVYSLATDQLRLVSARRIDTDLNIFDGSIEAPKSIEGGNGVTTEEAEDYLANIKKDPKVVQNARPKYDK